MEAEITGLIIEENITKNAHTIANKPSFLLFIDTSPIIKIE